MKFKEYTVKVVNAREFSTFVSKVLDRDYEFILEEEAYESDHFYPSITGRPDFSRHSEASEQQVIDWFDQLEINTVQEWVDEETDSYPGTHNLLTWLCLHKHIEPGNYLICCV